MKCAKSNESRDWYEEHAGEFRDALTVEVGFIGLPVSQQDRLNRFKLWPFREGGLLHWRDMDVLDFGAGHGRVAFEFPDFHSYLGIDLSPKLVRIGRERIRLAGLDNAELEAGDILEFSGSPQAYDIVFALGMLPYVNDLDAAIGQMARHLRPGGRLVGDFRRSSLHYDFIRKIKWRLADQTGGVSRVYSESRIRDILTAAGLVDIRVEMREYPLLASWYARREWEWPLRVRNQLAARSCLNFLATEGYFMARRPKTSQ